MDRHALTSLDVLLQNVVVAANDLSGSPISDALRDALNAFANRSDRDAVARGLATSLSAIQSPQGAGTVALYLGTAVEYGCDPEPAIPFLMDALLRWSKTIGTNDEGELEGTLDDDVLSGMQLIGQGLVAHLARSSVQRMHFNTLPDVIAELERTEHLSVGVCWVADLLRKCSGTLLVLHVEQRQGCVVGYQNLANCFHLFTLLQDSLAGIMPGARAPSSGVLAVATGSSTENVNDTACWHYGRGDVPESNILASVWGEGSPAQIPIFDEYQVLLLWPPILSSRGWDGGFFMPYLAAAPPGLKVLHPLSSDQVDKWWERLGLRSTADASPHTAVVAQLATPTSAAVKPWWKIW